MRADEAQALGRLAGEGVGGAATRAHELHHAVAGRVFGALGPEAAPVRRTHDAVAATVYATVRHAAGVGGHVAGAAAGLARAPGAASLSDHLTAAPLLGALNGVLGDRMHEHHDVLAGTMSIRVDGRPVALRSEALAAAHPGATGRVAVFLHGLCETERAWSLGTAHTDGPPRPTYAQRLQADAGLSPVLVRYNSGRRISDNGAALDDLLDALVARWPVPVRELVLVGHSMGGLVIRSACHRAHAAQRRWRARLTHVVMLGTPHLGAPLEQQVNRATRALRRLPEARPLLATLDARSAGIRDLRFGAITEEDWRDRLPDHAEDPCGDAPLLEGVRHCTVSATLSARPDGLAGRLVGDLLVTHTSATGAGRRRRIALSAADTVHLGGLSHFALLNHPRVYAQLREWLVAAPAADAGDLIASPAR